MPFRSLMVHIDLDRPNDARIKIAGSLAERCGAGVIGIAACRALPVAYSDGYAAGRLIEEERKAIASRMKEAETRFRGLLGGHAKFTEWRSAIGEPTEYILDHARAADLIILGTGYREESFNPMREVDPAQFLAAAGRPILLVPHDVERLTAKNVLIAWKDTREARRAVLNALPLLSLCENAIVAQISEGNDPTTAETAVNDVVVWLSRHGIKARGLAPSLLESVAQQLDSLAIEEDADLIVAGAYGHSRFREWVLGGATRDFMMRMPRCVLLAH
jgi:nucleotide-binding universal stress UspA family protein